jgi:hypothetical protein
VIFFLRLWIKGLKAGRQNNRPYIDFLLLGCLFQVDSVVLANPFANATFVLFKIKTAFVYISDQWNGLREIDVYRFILGYLLIVLIRVFGRAVLHAGGAPRALVLENIPGLLDQRDPEVSHLSLDTIHFRVRQDLDVRMPADLDQFRCEKSHGAVIGGKGLVQLSHVAPDARGLFHQVDLETGRGKVKRGLYAADPSAHHHDVSKRAVL